MPRCERQRSLEGHLADAREQLLVDLRDVAADHDDLGVEEVHQAGEDLAEQRPASRTSRTALELPPRTRSTTSRLLTAFVPASVSASASASPAGQGLEAADVAAVADHLVVAGDPDVADVARRALRAAMDVPAGDDAAADPGADLDHQEVLGVGQGRQVLAEGHDVDVVVDQHRYAVAVANRPGSRTRPTPA